MADRPILFRSPLVRAILDDRKTVTRRLCSAQPRLPGVTFAPDPAYPGAWLWGTPAETLGTVRCPYGAPGDRLWVKERWRPAGRARTPTGVYIDYSAGCETWVMPSPDPVKWGAADPGPMRSPLYMPRWASRLTLDVVSVRAKRLWDIDDADARREGCDGHTVDGRAGYPIGGSPRDEFRDLWDAINGTRPGASWSDNPWVWRVEFRRAADAAGGAA